MKRVSGVCSAGILWVAMLVTCRPALAQNVSGYDAIPNPYLLLLREPAVHQDLKLKSTQKQELLKLNAELDGELLAMRNWPAEKSDAKFSELVAQTRTRLESILDRDQIERISQIMLRLKGIESVLLPIVGERLRLSSEQREAIEEIVKDSRDRLDKLRNRARAPATDEVKKIIEQRHSQVLGNLSDLQKKELAGMLGARFDPSKLGRVSFKAPEFTGTGEWINTEPLTVAGLRGQVVAVHFWTFG